MHCDRVMRLRRHVYTFNFQLEAWSLEACTELCLSKSQPELVHILYEQKGYFWKHVLFWELPSSCCYWFTFQIGLTTLTRLLKREEPLTFLCNLGVRSRSSYGVQCNSGKRVSTEDALRLHDTISIPSTMNPCHIKGANIKRRAQSLSRLHFPIPLLYPSHTYPA